MHSLCRRDSISPGAIRLLDMKALSVLTQGNLSNPKLDSASNAEGLRANADKHKNYKRINTHKNDYEKLTYSNCDKTPPVSFFTTICTKTVTILIN